MTDELMVVNFSTPQFLNGQARLANSLKGKCLFTHFSQYSEIGSPTHEQSPYQFKIHAIEKAIERGYSTILWADSSMYLVGDINRIKTIIQRDGYFMEEAGHYVRNWCKDETLKYFKIDRTCDYTLFTAGLLGLSTKSAIAMEFLKRWKQSALDGQFKGDWKTHRHDMTCGSIIAYQMGMKYHSCNDHLCYIGAGYAPPKEGVIFYCQGIR